MAGSYFGFAMEIVSCPSVCTPGKIVYGFLRFLESHGRSVGAFFDIYDYGDPGVFLTEKYNSSIPDSEVCRIRVEFSNFNKGYGLECGSLTSTLLVEYHCGSCKINLNMFWYNDFFCRMESIWRNYPDRFPPIRYRKHDWLSGEVVVRQVTMDTPVEYGEAFYARLAYDLVTYFWSAAELEYSISSEGCMNWGEGMEFGSVRFLD